MTKSVKLPFTTAEYESAIAKKVQQLMNLEENRGISEKDIRHKLSDKIIGSNKDIATVGELLADIKKTQELEAKKNQATDDVFKNLWGGVSGLAGAAGDALDAEKKRVENAIKKHTQTEANQQQVTRSATERTQLLGDAVARELWEKRENQESEREPLLRLSSASSESGVSSKSGSSRDGSTDSRDTIKSGVRALEALTDQRRKTEGPQNGPFASPPKLSESKGLKSEGDKKTQFADWGEAVKNGFSKCQTCLYNAGAFAFSSVKKFFNDNLVEPISKHFREPDASERKRIDESYRQIQRERQAYKEAEKELLMAPFKAVRAKFRRMWSEEMEYDKFDTTFDMRTGVSNRWKGTRGVSMEDTYYSAQSAGIRAGTGGAQLGLRGVKAAKGLPGSLKSAGVAIGKFVASAGRFAVTDNGYGSSRTSWADQVRSASSAFEGMGGSNVGAGSGAHSMTKFGFEALSEMRPSAKTFTPGKKCKKVVNALGSMGSMASRVRGSITLPTIGLSSR